MREEERRDIKGREGYYQVSDLGRVRSLDRIIDHVKSGPSAWKGKILSQTISRDKGYLKCSLCRNSKRAYKKVHRLVLQTFYPTTENLEVNHKNGIKIDNRLENLEWLTHLENIRHGIRTGLTDPAKNATSKRNKLLST